MRTITSWPSTASNRAHSRQQATSMCPSHLQRFRSALALLNSDKSGAHLGWYSELPRYSYQEVTGGDGSVSKFHVLARPLTAILDAAFPETMKSSLATQSSRKVTDRILPTTGP